MGDQACAAPGLTADWLNAWLAAIGVTVLVPQARLSDPFPNSTNPLVPPAGTSLGRYSELGSTAASIIQKQNLSNAYNDRFNFSIQRQIFSQIAVGKFDVVALIISILVAVLILVLYPNKPALWMQGGSKSMGAHA